MVETENHVVDLKPCPFCGGTAYFRNPIPNGTFSTMIVECKRCGASPYAMDVYKGNSIEDKRKAIAAVWNRRTNC